MSTKESLVALSEQQIEEFANQLSGSSAEDIRKFINRLTNMLEVKQKKETSDLHKEMLERASALGYDSLENFLEAVPLSRSGKASGTKKTVAIRYRDPENQANTWTARGKQPKWLVAKLEAGHKLEEFLIEAEKTA